MKNIYVVLMVCAFLGALFFGIAGFVDGFTGRYSFACIWLGCSGYCSVLGIWCRNRYDDLNGW